MYSDLAAAAEEEAEAPEALEKPRNRNFGNASQSEEGGHDHLERFEEESMVEPLFAIGACRKLSASFPTEACRMSLDHTQTPRIGTPKTLRLVRL